MANGGLQRITNEFLGLFAQRLEGRARRKAHRGLTSHGRQALTHRRFMVVRLLQLFFGSSLFEATIAHDHCAANKQAGLRVENHMCFSELLVDAQ